jgi:hypothetical protein
MIKQWFFLLLATVTVQQRSLDNPNCKVKSYINGQIYTFIGVIDKETGKNYDSIEKLAADFGSDWDGHRLECEGESQNHQLINHLGEVVLWSKDLTKRQAQSSGATNNNSNNGKTTEISDSSSDVQNDKTFGTSAGDTPKEQPITIDDIPQVIGQQAIEKKEGQAIVEKTNTMPAATIEEIQARKSKCLPLISKHPGLNPYHPLLTPPKAATRRILAFPKIIENTATVCEEAEEVGSCALTITKGETYSKTISYQITKGRSNTFITSNTYGTGNIDTSTTSKDISDIIGSSLDFTTTSTRGGNEQLTVTDSLELTTNLQFGYSKMNGTNMESSDTDTTSVDSQTNFNLQNNSNTAEEIREDESNSWGRFNFN